MRDEGAERDIDNNCPPFRHKPEKYHFQERKNATSCD